MLCRVIHRLEKEKKAPLFVGDSFQFPRFFSAMTIDGGVLARGAFTVGLIILLGAVVWGVAVYSNRGHRSQHYHSRQLELGSNWLRDRFCQEFPLLPLCVENIE